jgi:hypothetical protein
MRLDRRQREQVVAAEQRLQDDVVERERQRSAEHDERALGALQRDALASSRNDDDRDACEGDRETGHLPWADRVQADERGQDER